MKAEPECIFQRSRQSDLLTVCIPTYCRHQDLVNCLEKLASDYNEFPFFDILVVDNDSRDQTLQVLKAKQLVLPSMSVYAWPCNTGAVNNTQQLSSFVDTEFMMWLTDDDYLLDGAIKKCLMKIPTFQEQNIDWIFSPLDTFNPEGSLLCTVAPRLSHSQIIPAWSSHCARYAWAFSRQIWKTEYLRVCQERINASSFLSNSGYWMIYPAVLAISASKAFFWNESLVYHVYGNVVHWEEFGPEGLKRKARLSLDFNMTYLLGALDFLKARISISRVYLQLVQFTKVASHQNFYRDDRFATINLRSCLSIVVYQQTYIRHILAIGFIFLIFISYPSLLINRITKRFGFG